METKETRGERIRRLREERELTQLELAVALGYTKAAVSKWESAAEPNIDLATFFKLADVLRVDPRELATGIRPARDLIPQNRLDLIKAYSRLPSEIRTPIRSLIETLATAQNERYATWSRAEGVRAKSRDDKAAKEKATEKD